MKIVSYSTGLYDIPLDLPYATICSELPPNFLTKKIYGTLRRPLILIDDIVLVKYCTNYNNKIKTVNIENQGLKRSVYLIDVYNIILYTSWYNNEPYRNFVARCLDSIDNLYRRRSHHANNILTNSKIASRMTIQDLKAQCGVYAVCETEADFREQDSVIKHMFPTVVFDYAQMQSFKAIANCIACNQDFEYLN